MKPQFLKNDTELFLIEVQIVDLRVYFALVLFVAETFDGSPLQNVFGDEFGRVLGFHLDVERLVRKDLDDRPLLAKSETSGFHDLDVVLCTRFIEFFDDVVVDVIGFTRFTAGSAAYKNVPIIGHFTPLAFRHR